MKKQLYVLGSVLLLSMVFVTPLKAQNDHYPQFMEMGNRAYNNQNIDLARDYYQSALDDNSDCWQAYVGLGNCDYAKKKFKEALKNYEKALKMHPDNPNLTQFLQALRYKMGIFPTPTPTPVPLVPTPARGTLLPPSGALPLPK
jgi:tetratricopeptide (TPR) repeat protein